MSRLLRRKAVPAEPDLEWISRAHLISSSLSFAREMWRYGEPQLAEQALELSPEEVLAVGDRAIAIVASHEADTVWPDGPQDRGLLIAVVERLEGRGRPLPRVRRLPERSLPRHLQATLEERYKASEEVANVLLERYAREPSPR